MHLIQTEENRRCPACGDERSELFCEARDRLCHTTDQAFTYRRCASCKTIFQALRPVPPEIWKCYSDSYGPYASRARQQRLIRVPVVVSRAAQSLADRIVGSGAFQHWMRGVEQRLAHAGEILDFGCGAGKYLDRARKLGCKTLGLDFSPKALEEAARRGHETLPVSDATWDAISVRRLKFVRMNHVVEHLYDPLLILRKIHDAMDRGGFLHLSTPNPLGPSATRYNDAWFGLDCPRHIALIPPAQLEKMLKQVGFGTVAIIQDPGPKDLLRSWAYRRSDTGGMKNVDIEGLAGDGVLNLIFSFRFARYLRSTGHADRYHVLAEKAR
jgi:2-polyprenyl-3-methyl-5-hydroxy-6-metoxy-1,4-benzoquinol methylase